MCLENLRYRILCAHTMDARRGSYGDASRKAGCWNQHVRFDERGRETERAFRAQPPRPSSTLPNFVYDLLFCCRFFSRTPGPPPFSSMNSTPADSNLPTRSLPCLVPSAQWTILRLQANGGARRLICDQASWGFEPTGTEIGRRPSRGCASSVDERNVPYARSFLMGDRSL
jgi:hypothetical protein